MDKTLEATTAIDNVFNMYNNTEEGQERQEAIERQKQDFIDAMKGIKESECEGLISDKRKYKFVNFRIIVETQEEWYAETIIWVASLPRVANVQVLVREPVYDECSWTKIPGKTKKEEQNIGEYISEDAAIIGYVIYLRDGEKEVESQIERLRKMSLRQL